MMDFASPGLRVQLPPPVEKCGQYFQIYIKIGIAMIGQFDVTRGDALLGGPVCQVAGVDAAGVNGWVGILAHPGGDLPSPETVSLPAPRLP